MAKSLIEPELCVEFPRIHVRVSTRPPNVKALACELPARAERPLARWSMSELAAETERTGLVASISGSTIWRWLHNDAIRPWFHRSWISSRDPEFASKAGQILDLYERVWKGSP